MSAGLPLEPVIRFFAEITIIGLAGWYVFFHLEVARHLTHLGRIPLVAFWLLMASWLGVQLVERVNLQYPQEFSYYPLTRFAMYEARDPTETVPSYYIEGAQANGAATQIDPAEWFPSVEPTSLDNRFLVLIGWLESGNPENAARASREVERYLSGLRTLLAESAEPVPTSFLLHSTSHRVRDGVVVADSVIWRTPGVEGER